MALPPVLLMRSRTVDGDERQLLLAIRQAAGPALVEPTKAVDAGSVAVLRAAVALLRHRLRRSGLQPGRVLITVGEAATAAARLGWRGAWLASARPQRPGRRHPRDPGVRHLQLCDATDDLDRPAPGWPVWIDARSVPVSEIAGDRDRTRRQLGLRPDSPVIYAPATVTPFSGHRLVLRAVGMLHFRDRRVRMLLDLGGHADTIVDAARQLGMHDLVTLPRDVPPRDLAAAADVAVVGGPADSSALAACVAERLPVLTSYRRPSHHPLARAMTVVASDPQSLARATLEVLEAPPTVRSTDAHLCKTLIKAHYNREVFRKQLAGLLAGVNRRA